jgi:hypothetical protein
MKSYILRAVDTTLRQRLIDSGVTFYDWNSDVVVEQAQYKLALAALNARGTEKATEYENMFEVALEYGRDELRPAQEEGISAAVSAQVEERAQARAGYILACAARFKGLLDQAANDLTAKQKSLTPVQSRFVTLSRQAHIAADIQDNATRSARWLEEFQRLSQVPKIHAVRVTRGAILLYTDLIYATKAGTNKRHELGKFIIVIQTDGQGEPILWLNQSRRVDGIRPTMNAPYVFASGAPMASEMQETLIQLIAQFEFSVVAEIAIQFLESVEDDEPGKRIDKWPWAPV